MFCYENFQSYSRTVARNLGLASLMLYTLQTHRTAAAKAALVFQAEEGARLALEYQKLVGELQLLQECHK